MIKQYYLGCLSHASYLLWDPQDKQAIVVDPQRDVQQYLDDAEALGVTIKKVVLTHFHADFIAGHLELQAATGAAIVMGHRAEAEFAIQPAHHGDVWDHPSLSIEVLESPGHTPEMINLLVTDKTDPDAPRLVLTGDTLFNGDVGRPDLLASRGVTQEELGAMLYDSVQMLKALPDDTIVYPAHGAGSLCGKALAEENVTTIGAQKASNYAMRTDDREAFIRLVTADQPTAPAYFQHDAELNRRRRTLLEQALASAHAVDVETLLRRAKEGAQVVDTRDADAFAAGHLPGSINIGLDGTYATWCGTVLDRDRPILIVADPGKHEESAVRLGRIGYDHFEGFLDGGFPSLAGRPELLRQATRRRAADFERHDGIVLDVRSATERAGGHIPGSIHIPLDELPQRLHDVPRDTPVLVHCAGGYRSSLAASLLRKHGLQDIVDLQGGIDAYVQAGHPLRRVVQGIEQVRVQEVPALLQAGVPVIDVREPDERTADHVEGTLFRPLSRLHEWEHEFDGQSVVFQCRSGNRSQQVALYLGDRVRGANLEGGILAYRAEGLP